MITDTAALAGVASALTDAGRTSSGEAALFWVLAPLMVLAALGLLFSRKAIYAALGVVAVMISLAFLYVAQDAPFLGVAQVVVYTGAIMMLFLFVLMLVGVDSSDSLTETLRGQRWVGIAFGLGLGALLVGVVTQATFPAAVGLDAANADTNPVGVARLVFGDFIFAFEVVGVLLVTAALGALVLTHRQRLTRHIGQKERAEARVAAGAILTPLPAPGVYARSNAMDVPALDPTGAPIEISVSRVLRIRGQERGSDQVAAQLEPDGSNPPPTEPPLIARGTEATP
ncbi:NADH-quinone oxidoreductase subunit J [Pengzhenrongella sicca]|uniref:NADH-quinone oxidoreductase subunit J n=1 Tax=Pengzhenrongella sicca TaxID=2819238 RepID=A0A8A4ZDY4_9MICO|nr:NADH-quinone oxidoreductase subunit J [Pengzhenrongella sicca]QTE29123.1 NADH-quinone oxidoreductase subunit J [Pengzhenrongella sicca]